MKSNQIIALIIVLLAGVGVSFWVFQHQPDNSPANHGHGHGHGHGPADPHAHGEEEPPRGPHGGRLLQEKDFALEMTIYEDPLPPRFRIYPFHKQQPLDPAAVRLTLELHRLGGRVDRFALQPQKDYLTDEQIVGEPHSFLVKVQAEFEGASYAWEYESYEGRTEFTPAMVEESGITLERTGPREISTLITTYGRIAPNEDHLAYVIPRLPGTVVEARKRLGDPVDQGEVLATIQSSQTLQDYPVASPLAGTILQKNVTPGELTVPHQAIYTVANLDTVWVDLHVYPRDFSRVHPGKKAWIKVADNLPVVEGEISYVSPLGTESNQSVLARLVLPNPRGYLRPGLFVSARIQIERHRVPVAVRKSALQTFRDWQVVFIKEGNVFEFRPVQTGREDDQWVEIVEGLPAGQEYAAENSFIIKADILKSGASHDH